MYTSEHINELAAALAKAQGQFVPAKYDAQNPHLKNRYTTLAAVWDAIRGPLSDNGLSVAQIVTADGDNMVLATRLMHASGQFIEATYPVNAGDGRGISSAQAVGSALTYARRYSLTALVGVVSDDDDDGNSAGQQRQLSQQQRQPQPQPGSHTTNSNKNSDPPGFAVWADWQSLHDAKRWAMQQGKFAADKHMENAYTKVKAETQPKTPAEMWAAWYEYVTAHEEVKPKAVITDAELDGTVVEEKPPF